MRLQIIYNMYKDDSALNNLQGLICHKTQPNQTNPRACSLNPNQHFGFSASNSVRGWMILS